MSSGFHRMGANLKGKALGWSNARMPWASIDVRAGLDVGVLTRAEAIEAKGGDVPAHEPDSGPTIGFHAVLKDPPPAPLDLVPQSRAMAQAQGFTGDQCSHCNSMRMQIAGHCMVCADCGTTTGCS